MKDARPSNRSPWGVGGALAQMRDYRDDAALDRAWNRLQTHRRRSLALAPSVRLVAAAALVCAGALGGIVFERSRAPMLEPTAVASEVIEAPVPAAPLDQQRGRVLPSRTDKSETNNARRNRSLVRRSPVTSLTQEGDESGEDVVEAPIIEAQEALAPPKASWIVSAERGDFAAAFQELDESGGFDSILATGGPEELMTLHEVARFVGRNGRAIQALRVVTTRYESDANAPIAAMILGNLLSRAGDAAGAAEAYALNRRLSPGGDFAEDALVREFDMAMADGDLASVERLKAQYEAEFPDGRHLDEIRSEAARLASHVPRAADRDSSARDSSARDSSARDSAEGDSHEEDTDSENHDDDSDVVDPHGND